jgi:hypothetical protein
MISNYKWYQQIYLYSIYLSFLLFTLTLTGVGEIAPLYSSNLQIFLRYYVCIFLIVRFNPYTDNMNISKSDALFDRKIAFTSGIFLLLSTSIMDVISNYINVNVDRYTPFIT